MRLTGHAGCQGAFLALTLAYLAGCASRAPVEGPVRLGQIATVGGPRVRADRIIEDSRCPVGFDCFQAGRLIVRTTVLGGGWSRSIDLTLGVPVHVADGNLTLISATPPPRPGSRDGHRPSYRFTFRFQGGL
jgi:hypothetical protein